MCKNIGFINNLWTAVYSINSESEDTNKNPFIRNSNKFLAQTVSNNALFYLFSFSNNKYLTGKLLSIIKNIYFWHEENENKIVRWDLYRIIRIIHKEWRSIFRSLYTEQRRLFFCIWRVINFTKLHIGTSPCLSIFKFSVYLKFMHV